MKFVFYTHSLVSDWNHGNAHFLRGVMRDLIRRGHAAIAYEPADGWSRENLLRDQGPAALDAFSRQFPDLRSRPYEPGFNHEVALAGADVVVVHEWTDPVLVARLGWLRKSGAGFTLLFHDTHHRAISARQDIARLDLDGYDGVLAFGEPLRQRYLDAGWGHQVFTWHEGADDALFQPMPDIEPRRDLVWVGNWGDNERSQEIRDFLVEPVRALRLSASVHGVRYPAEALSALEEAGIDYRGWLANAGVPRTFAEHRMTVHIPRRPYVESLPGIPTIRVFEALSCGIPLISAPWDDAEGLFRQGTDYLMARNGAEMTARMRDLLHDPALAASLAQNGLETIRARHTCRHRVDELLAILDDLGGNLKARAIPEKVHSGFPSGNAEKQRVRAFHRFHETGKGSQEAAE
ncbi:glycosyltransferase [Allorhizobium sp. BGMRC 0089]|uniref:CgeB family protein n=1 Tax=Allorhizobium sonneratiae TaxID=2934936 RepID=UPI0020348F4A|nr:glycosyltransferase [Allorhizobium sonneratiae]MCM2293984.1 glycosyltransferase [Allorhizobium sonneratiae]